MHRPLLLTGACALLVLLAGCAREDAPPVAASTAPSTGPSTAQTSRPAAGAGDAQAEGREQAAGGPEDPATDAPPATDEQPPATPGRTLPAAERRAGVLERTVPQRGSGRTEVVPGTESAPRDGRLRRVRVEVEGGLPVDGRAFAAMVMSTLNDRRSWPSEGWTFARTDGDADVVVRLASPQTSAKLCHPLRTRGTLSCRSSEGVIITHHRWVRGQEDYGDDLTGYRQYVVNHEVGHALGHGHRPCPRAGALAPVMQQQTIDVDPCVPNAWVQP